MAIRNFKNTIIKAIAASLVCVAFLSFGASVYADPEPGEGETAATAQNTDNTDETQPSASINDPDATDITTEPANKLITVEMQRNDLLTEDQGNLPKISSSAYILYDAESGAIIAGHNYNDRMEPASTTKVMTVLLALETLDMSETVTINSDMAAQISLITDDYVKLGLQENEEISVKDLVYASVLKSANDAALVLGMYMGGTEEDFCKKMNAKAKEIGCINTTFTSSYGQAKSTNMLSAYDLALILEEAVTKTDYTKIAKTLSYTIPATNKYSESRELTNANRFVCTTEYGYEYYIGGKTGYTDTAGYTLCAASRKNDRTLIGVVLNATTATSRYSDLISLFEYGYSDFTTVSIDPSEFTGLVNETNQQLEELLSQTDLYLSEENTSYVDYLTITAGRAQMGSTNKVELADVVVDTTQSKQELNIPLCKVYSDKTYVVGNINIEIRRKSGIVEINPEKKSTLTPIRNILITAAVVAGLILILIVSLLIFRHMLIRRKGDNFRGRSKML
ncbi:MAG: D-alanyl-D-alanine carboxypeptidase [Clostridiales bacterium]|nr:D-alanyl-D-alanine carboxypeptidase [Clostridiales bacterium]